MSKVKESEAVFRVKINMENDEIEVLADNKGNENDTAEHCTTNETDPNRVQLVIMEDDDGLDEEDAEDSEKVNEILEHVCGKCFRTYSNLNRLKKHLKYCRTQTKMDTTEEQNEFIKEMENNITTIEEEANKMAERQICFCCEDNFETCHSGHIRCYECPKSFKNSKSFERHVFLIHSGNENFPCQTCNARCPTKEILELHQKSHTLGKPFACKKCGKEFTRRYHLFRHQHYSTCDNSTPKEEMLCKVCGKVFYRIDNLRSHLRQHLGDERKNRDYQCPYCDKSFYGTATLNIHIRSHTGERPFPCDLCEKSFPSNAALRKHRRSHTGEKPYTCKVCSKSFAAKEVLNRHTKTHTGERPHSCEKCGKSFIQATQLKNHNEAHHSTEQIQCTICDAEFSSQQKLQKHIRTSHSSKNDSHKCEICHESFKSAGGLKRHASRMHTMVEFVCGVCDKIFTIKKNLDFHMLLHDDTAETSKHAKKTLTPIVTTEVKEGKAIELGKIEEEDLRPKVEVEEYILEEIPSLKSEASSDSEASDHTLMEVVDEEDVLIMDESTLKNNVEKLLDILLDADVLEKFGWPKADVDYVLQEVIKNCGHTPVGFEKIKDYATKMREYVKLLFTVVIDNDSIKELLNNHSIDEVINQVLKMAKAN